MSTMPIRRLSRPSNPSTEEKIEALWRLAVLSLSPVASSDAARAATLSAAQKTGVTTSQYLQARLLLSACVPAELSGFLDQDE